MGVHRVIGWVMVAAVGWILASAASAGSGASEKPEKLWVYIGTYTDGKSKGIYRAEFDVKTGKLSTPVVAAELRSPSFLAIHPNRHYLYAVNESDQVGASKSGQVSALALDTKTGELKVLNQQSSGGNGPCHIVVDKDGKNALIANYGGGSAGVLPIGPDGKLEKMSSFEQHKGSSVNKSRQEAPHAHSINLDPSNRFAYVADLGLDKVMVYRFDAGLGTLTPNSPPCAEVKPGAGPRHFAFHPSGSFAYVINELDSTITAFRFNLKSGSLSTIETVSTLPAGYKGNTTTAEVVVHPSGKFLYGSNRGHDSIAAFTIDEETGKLTFVGHQKENIKTPRNFAVDPTGAYAIVANQGSGSMVVFRVNQKTGALETTGNVVQVPAPVCVRMVAIEK
jgi:6-phosphogluconolactonase